MLARAAMMAAVSLRERASEREREMAALEASSLPPDVAEELRKSMSKSLVCECDMSHEVQSEALDIITSALDKNPGGFEAAARHIKESMDKKFGPTWHCIIGEGYSFQVTCQSQFLLHLCYGNAAVLLFKC
jgi:dynein light chain 4